MNHLHKFDILTTEIVKNNILKQGPYNIKSVKRGLRHKNGRGIIAGLTSISNIRGLTYKNGKTIPTEGKLSYRGIDIKTLVEDFNFTSRYCFEQTVFLLLVGRKPDHSELKELISIMAENRKLDDSYFHFIKNLKSTNLMNKIQTAISALYGEDSNPESNDPTDNFIKSIHIISKLPIIISYLYLNAHFENPKFVVPREDYSTAENFIYLLNQGQEPNQFASYIFDLCLVLHAEHGGGNNSTFTTRVVSSSGSDIYSTLAAAIGSLKGPLHGGANQKIADMITDIKNNVENASNKEDIQTYLEKIIKKEAFDKTGKIYGLGHAVYTKSDPRAEILKVYVRILSEITNRKSDLNLYLNIADLGPSIFKKLKKTNKAIAPNVDFFSGLIYESLSLPKEIYTPIFAMSRTAGWCAHRIEEMLVGKRIIRPAYMYVGT
jgi:citrate synthase